MINVMYCCCSGWKDPCKSRFRIWSDQTDRTGFLVGVDRDKIANRHGILAFEMEATGVWDELPCIMVKGVCDYADSHKNKEWQYFAAATAASATKALLERYIETDRSPRGM